MDTPFGVGLGEVYSPDGKVIIPTTMEPCPTEQIAGAFVSVSQRWFKGGIDCCNSLIVRDMVRRVSEDDIERVLAVLFSILTLKELNPPVGWKFGPSLS